MIVPDLNLLVYAVNAQSRHHKPAKAWWERSLNADEHVGLPWSPRSTGLLGHAAWPWVVLLGFLRLTTDAHLAALCIEHRATLHTADNDFSRFASLRWKNPVADK